LSAQRKIIKVIDERILRVALKIRFDQKPRKCEFSDCDNKIEAGSVAVIVANRINPSEPIKLFCSERCYERAGGRKLLQGN
jgi:hypothetical protein